MGALVKRHHRIEAVPLKERVAAEDCVRHAIRWTVVAAPFHALTECDSLCIRRETREMALLFAYGDGRNRRDMLRRRYRAIGQGHRGAEASGLASAPLTRITAL